LGLAQCSPLWLALLRVLALGRRPRKSSHLIAVIGLRLHRLPQRRGLICRQCFHQLDKMPPRIGGGFDGILGSLGLPLRMSTFISIATKERTLQNRL
jgi:hypothetical protein